MSVNGQPAEQTPWVPERREIRNSATHFEPREDGGMTLVFTPLAPAGPGAWAACPWQYTISFGAGGWERFKRDCDRGGKSPVEVATLLPPKDLT